MGNLLHRSKPVETIQPVYTPPPLQTVDQDNDITKALAFVQDLPRYKEVVDQLMKGNISKAIETFTKGRSFGRRRRVRKSRTSRKRSVSRRTSRKRKTRKQRTVRKNRRSKKL